MRIALGEIDIFRKICSIYIVLFPLKYTLLDNISYTYLRAHISNVQWNIYEKLHCDHIYITLLRQELEIMIVGEAGITRHILR
jgi:hypothetical protein